jgi:hypothetical protein
MSTDAQAPPIVAAPSTQNAQEALGQDSAAPTPALPGKNQVTALVSELHNRLEIITEVPTFCL